MRYLVKRNGTDAHPDPNEVSKLSVGVDVHLDNTMPDGSLDLLLRRAGAAVEDEEPGGK